MSTKKVHFRLSLALAVIGVAGTVAGVLFWSNLKRAEATPVRSERAKIILYAIDCSIIAATVGDQPMKWSWLDMEWQAYVSQGEQLLKVATDVGGATTKIHLRPEHRGGELYIIVDGKASPPMLKSTDLGFKVPLQANRE